MLFNSYFFLFLFLPLALIGWYALNRMGRLKIAQGYLIGMSLWFYAWYNVSFLWVMLGSCLFNFGVSFFLSGRDTPRMRRFLLITGCVVNIGALGIFKYYNFFVENVNAVFGADFQTRNILLPLGISFFTFQQLSYLIDRCRGDAPHYGLMDYLSFVTFFPSLISGPIVLHASTVPQFQDETRRRFSAESFSRGVMQFSIGLAKKVLLANTLGTTFYALSALPMTQLSTLSAPPWMRLRLLQRRWDIRWSCILTSAVIPIWLSAWEKCSGSRSRRTLTPHAGRHP